MALKTADDLVALSVNGFGTNLSMLDFGVARKDKWELERRILISQSLLNMVEADYLAWQARVGQGQQPFEQGDENKYAKLFNALIAIFDSLYGRAKGMEREINDHVAHSDDLYIWGLRTRKLLKEKCVPPVPSRMVFDITDEDEADLRDLAAAPPGSPGKLNFATKRIPTAGASALK